MRSFQQIWQFTRSGRSSLRKPSCLPPKTSFGSTVVLKPDPSVRFAVYLALSESSLTHGYLMRRVIISLYDHRIHLFSPKMDDSYAPGYLDGDELLKVKESCKPKSAAERGSLKRYYREENERRKKKQLPIIPLNVGGESANRTTWMVGR